MITFFELAHMVGATQVMGWGGVGMVTFIELAHMVGATQQHVPCTCTEVWLLEASCLLVRCSNNLCGKCEKNAVMC